MPKGMICIDDAEYRSVLISIAVLGHIKDGDRRTYDRERILDAYNGLNRIADMYEHAEKPHG
jgi:hypothetical protein